MQNVLVIGGSYFLGRVFNTLASRAGDLRIDVVNRGRYKLNKPNISEYVCDRHDSATMQGLLAKRQYDAVVDFCAYQPGEISQLTSDIAGRFSQYIFISTSSVYCPQQKTVKTEAAPLLTQFDNDQVSSYIANKLALERELAVVCAAANIRYTIIRPAFVYGPFNYAPRESFFIKKIAKSEPVPVPSDSTARFSMVFVSDLARQIKACIGNERCLNSIFNSAAPGYVNYRLLIAELQRCTVAKTGSKFILARQSVKDIIENNVPLPFPLIDDDLVDGSELAISCGERYSTFSEGMDKTFAAFWDVYTS
jgi:nucleoside-diphosphate-sugar epimerase